MSYRNQFISVINILLIDNHRTKFNMFNSISIIADYTYGTVIAKAFITYSPLGSWSTPLDCLVLTASWIAKPASMVKGYVIHYYSRTNFMIPKISDNQANQTFLHQVRNGESFLGLLTRYIDT